LAFWYDHCTALLLKNRKTDRLGLVTTSSKLYEDAQFTYDRFKLYSQHLENQSAGGHFLEALVAAIDTFRDKIHLKYLRHLIVITNAKDSLDFDIDLEETTKLINQYGIKVIFTGDFDDSSKTFYGWKRLLAQWDHSRIVHSKELHRTIAQSVALRKVAPRATFTGCLRFAVDVEADTLNQDNSAIKIDIQLYPAIKVEKTSSSHEYVFDDETKTIRGLQRTTTHFIKKYTRDGPQDLLGEENDSDNEDYNKEVISDYVPGFKYSKRDIIAVNKELAEVSQLPTSPGMDILGFVKKQHISLAYLVDESSYIIPPSNSSNINLVSFNALVRSLIDMDGVALARYVSKENSEVQVCALFPLKFQLKENSRYGLVSIRLAFKEDEKMGRFPSLTKDYTSANNDDDDKEDEDEEETGEDGAKFSNEKKRALPSSEANVLMEEFIKARDLDEAPGADSFTHVLDNQKLGLIDTEFLNLPKTVKGDPDTKLMPTCPATKKTQRYLKQILSTSVNKESLEAFLNEEKFVEKYLVEEGETNLFNYNNILTGNTVGAENWLTGMNSKSAPLVKKLITTLDSRYLKRNPEAKKRK
ncbi:SPOC domain-like protein, partial [Suhomyces tanzawaensis NRRL Y-17324]